MNMLPKCLCCSKHVPLPMKLIEIENNGKIIYVCPTTHTNLEEYIKLLDLYKGNPPGFVKKHYSKFVKELAQELK